MPALTKNEIRPTTSRESRFVDLAGGAHHVEHGDGGRQRIGQLLHRRRAGLLQMIGADVHRIPFRRLARRKQNEVLGQPQRRRRREHVGAARQIFLDDVVLRRALQRGARRALLVGDRDIERHQPGRRGVDRHRGVHLAERNAVEQRAHVAEMRNRDADLADLAARQRMVAVVAGLGRQIEGDRQAGLALGEIGAIKLVGFGRRRMAGVGAENPGRSCRALRPRSRWSPSGAMSSPGSLHRAMLQAQSQKSRPGATEHGQARVGARRFLMLATPKASTRAVSGKADRMGRRRAELREPVYARKCQPDAEQGDDAV